LFLDDWITFKLEPGFRVPVGTPRSPPPAPVPEPLPPLPPAPVWTVSCSCAACAWGANSVGVERMVVKRPLALVEVMALVFGTLTEVTNVLPPADPRKEENDSKDPRSDEARIAPPVAESSAVAAVSSVTEGELVEDPAVASFC